jgi:hypothetical protein
MKYVMGVVTGHGTEPREGGLMAKPKTAKELREKARERARRRREKLKEGGWRQITVILNQTDFDVIEELQKRHKGLGRNTLIRFSLAVALSAEETVGSPKTSELPAVTPPENKGS